MPLLTTGRTLGLLMTVLATLYDTASMAVWATLMWAASRLTGVNWTRDL
jgi:hypothetical protein